MDPLWKRVGKVVRGSLEDEEPSQMSREGSCRYTEKWGLDRFRIRIRSPVLGKLVYFRLEMARVSEKINRESENTSKPYLQGLSQEVTQLGECREGIDKIYISHNLQPSLTMKSITFCQPK